MNSLGTEGGKHASTETVTFFLRAYLVTRMSRYECMSPLPTALCIKLWIVVGS